jgi:hypothetical protein
MDTGREKAFENIFEEAFPEACGNSKKRWLPLKMPPEAAFKNN